MKNILVTGGAGYIGSHTVRKLEEAGYKVISFDNLSSGHKEALKGYNLIEGDLSNVQDLDRVFLENKITAVVHFAGSLEAAESMTDPRRFFQNNVVNALNLVNTMVDHGVKKIVFSSSAAVYGEPTKVPVEEDDPKSPTNYYGLTKLMFEEILGAYGVAYGMKSVSLRYFNAAGADESGEIGEDHKLETHLIPLVLATALGQRNAIKVFGTDFKTPDGTGVRDYVHVNDLADAHVLALEYLERGGKTDSFNLGNERGISVREVIEASEVVTKEAFTVVEAKRREGDPAVLVASSQKARRVLGWEPKFCGIDEIMRTAWNWHKNNPHGYSSKK